MKPSEYLFSYYLKDLHCFAYDWNIPSYGSFGHICGWTLSRLFEPSRVVQFNDPVGFLSSLYCLNLINQGIYTYLPVWHRQWQFRTPPFLDTRSSTCGHGGLSRIPNSLIRFARNPSYIPKAKALPIDDRLPEYVQFFFYEVIPRISYRAEILSNKNDKYLVTNSLINYLIIDNDCQELITYLR